MRFGWVVVCFLITSRTLAQCPSVLQSVSTQTINVPAGESTEIQMMLCSTLNSGCTTGHDEICSGSDCCSICGRSNSTNEQYAYCLGKYKNFEQKGDDVYLYYTGSDPVIVNTTSFPRITSVRVHCGYGQPFFDASIAGNFNGSAYIYEITAKSSFLCAAESAQLSTITIVFITLSIFAVIGGFISFFVLYFRKKFEDEQKYSILKIHDLNNMEYQGTDEEDDVLASLEEDGDEIPAEKKNS